MARAAVVGRRGHIGVSRASSALDSDDTNDLER